MYRFSEGSVVCFFGDSITHYGNWMRRIYDYYLNTLDIKCEMYNCGVAGDNAGDALLRLQQTVLVHEPTDVVISFGMNDVERCLYDGRDVTDEVVAARRAKIDECVANIRKIADELTGRGVRVIFATPTPYDELTEGSERCLTGGAAALKEVGDRVRLLSRDYGGHFVDFNTEVYDVLRALHARGQTLIQPDRVHPTAEGMELMAQVFLLAQGFDVSVDGDLKRLAELAEQPYNEAEQCRYQLEQKAKAADFLIWCICNGPDDHENIMKFIEKNIKTEKSEFVLGNFDAYLNDRHNLPLYAEQLVQQTKQMAKR